MCASRRVRRYAGTIAGDTQMISGITQADPFQAFGGAFDRAALGDDSALGAAWLIGDDMVAEARQHYSGRRHYDGALVDLSPPALHLELAIVQRPLLNAVATRHEAVYLLGVFWPLVLTIQGVSAAIWAHQSVAPWIGDVARLTPAADAAATYPPGFEVFLGLIDAVQLEPERMRGGIRSDRIEAIANAGDERWDAFLTCSNAAMRFVWAHELAHVLYGHVDLAHAALGTNALFEAGGEDDASASHEVFQFMEHVADMHAAVNIFTACHARGLESSNASDEQQVNNGAATVVGVMAAIYVLFMSDQFRSRPRGRRVPKVATHPPIEHRAAWVVAAESLALEAVLNEKQAGVVEQTVVRRFRDQAGQTLRGVAEVHESLRFWISRLDDPVAEDDMNSYVARIRASSEPHFRMLSKLQRI